MVIYVHSVYSDTVPQMKVLGRGGIRETSSIRYIDHSVPAGTRKLNPGSLKQLEMETTCLHLIKYHNLSSPTQN